MTTTITLTDNQVDALMWAIDLTEASYEGWSNADKGKETVSDLATLERVYLKLMNGKASA
jgi:hypothetical protein